mmetsp:Transcript_126739/g.222959  ORF Transcript_126739/g.222959 Transcript_126739/m.222959 type:complete len:276 (-) Transcript_126739:68-895(-)
MLLHAHVLRVVIYVRLSRRGRVPLSYARLRCQVGRLPCSFLMMHLHIFLQDRHIFLQGFHLWQQLPFSWIDLILQVLHFSFQTRELRCQAGHPSCSILEMLLRVFLHCQQHGGDLGQAPFCLIGVQVLHLPCQLRQLGLQAIHFSRQLRELRLHLSRQLRQLFDCRFLGLHLHILLGCRLRQTPFRLLGLQIIHITSQANQLLHLFCCILGMHIHIFLQARDLREGRHLRLLGLQFLEFFSQIQQLCVHFAHLSYSSNSALEVRLHVFPQVRQLR